MPDIVALTKFPPVRNRPVARFFYKGHHSHPIRRTVLLLNVSRRFLVGYVLREGNKVWSLPDAPVKSFLRSRIADAAQLRKDNSLRRSAGSTLRREGLTKLFVPGV